MERKQVIELYKTIIDKVLSGSISREEAVCELSFSGAEDYVYKTDDFFVSDCYFSIKHLTEENFETTLAELQYFKECIEGNRIYDLDEKNKLIEQFYTQK